MFRRVFKIVVFLVIANALYQVVPPVYRYQRFKAAAQDLALGAKGKADPAIITEVVELAAEYKVPIDRDWIAVRRSIDLTHTYIDATWVEEIRPVPGWKYTWIVDMSVDGWHLKPPAVREVP